MRFYSNFKEAMSEIRRDLAEMGVLIHPKTYQDQWVEGDPAFDTLELDNYVYCVLNPDTQYLHPTQPWADAEFEERICGRPVNPGIAWTLREDVWETFLDPLTGKFAYTYAERFSQNEQIDRIIQRLKEDPESRQLFLSMWNADDITKIGGVSRVPCTLGYLFQFRRGALNLTYLQRSSDFVTHFQNDVYLAVRMLEYVAGKTGLPVGTFTHWLGSLHTFRKDSLGVF